MADPTKEDIKKWWADNPMTYGTVHGKTVYSQEDAAKALGSREFFEKADERFYSWNTPLHTAEAPFGKIYDYAAFAGKSVLEVGCGMGCMAMNWARRGAKLTAVDLNPVSIEQTRRRFELFGLTGNIQQMDGNALEFPDNTFDYAYSWGVLHHSPDLKKSISEIYRVLKPGGKTGVMLYHRHSILYLYSIWLLEGYVHMENKFLTPVQLGSRYGDGAREEGNPHTWPITRKEAQDIFSAFKDVRVTVWGMDMESMFDLMVPRLGSWLIPKFIQKSFARRLGWSLWITGRKE